MKKFISAATDANPVDDILDSIEDDFDYAMAGIDKINRDGNSKTAMELAQNLSQSLQSIIESISAEI